MRIEDLRVLVLPQSQALLQQAAALVQADRLPVRDEFQLQQFLRRHFSSDTAVAATELLVLRSKAAVKFPAATCRWYDREGYEQSSGEMVAAHRARRFGDVAMAFDLCSGIGADSLAIGEMCEVVAVDVSPLRCELLRMNRDDFRPLHEVHIVCARMQDVEVGGAAFMDPSRRIHGQRQHDPEMLQPPLSYCLEVARRCRAAGIKLSPMTDLDRHQIFGSALFDCEVEFISTGGDCREQVLWFGEFRRARRRATVLPGGFVEADPTLESLPVNPQGRFLYVPDPAVARAHLSAECGAPHGLTRAAPGVELLTGDRLVEAPFFRAYRVRDCLPFRKHALRDHFHTHSIRPTHLLRRGARATETELSALFPRTGDDHCAVIFFGSGEQQYAAVCDPEPEPLGESV